jgi:hypothetical protein
MIGNTWRVLSPAGQCGCLISLIQAAARQRPGQVAQEGALPAAGIAEEDKAGMLYKGLRCNHGS